MRKVIFQEWLSMDSYAADANGSVSFIESTTLNKYSDLDQLAWLDSIDPFYSAPLHTGYLLNSGQRLPMTRKLLPINSIVFPKLYSQNQ